MQLVDDILLYSCCSVQKAGRYGKSWSPTPVGTRHFGKMVHLVYAYAQLAGDFKDKARKKNESGNASIETHRKCT